LLNDAAEVNSTNNNDDINAGDVAMIPVSDIERRFPRSLRNLFEEYSYRADHCLCFMNDGSTPILVFEEQRSSRNVLHKEYYQMLLKESYS
jgi:hypothetical protein